MIRKMCNNEGKSASMDSAAPLVDPGSAKINVLSFTPEAHMCNDWTLNFVNKLFSI